jgi:tRNA wybutosine-synthesizing protein 3
MDKFNQRKESLLSKEDKSSKGSWDERIISLCKKINSLDNYYTTSSCSGRIVVVRDQGRKEKGIFEFVSHEEVEVEEFIENALPPPSPKCTDLPARPDEEKLIGNKKKSENLKFKQDPFILHVACRTLEDARVLIEKGLKAGIKRSSVISMGENIIVEINSTEKLEFPLVENGKLLVSEDFLKVVIERANSNLNKGWETILKLKKLII